MDNVSEKKKTECELLRCPSFKGGMCAEDCSCPQNQYIVVDRVMPDILYDISAKNEMMLTVLEKISSGMGGDLLGTTSLSREDMQCLATAALLKVNGDRRTG